MGNFSVDPDVENKTSSHGHSMDGLDIAYVIVTVIMSLMSIVGCLVLLVVHWLFTDLRTVGRSMLAHLTVADLLTALGNLMGVTWYLNVETINYKMAYCKFHSALTIMSSIASFMWTVVIAWFVFWIILNRKPSTDQRHKVCSNKVLPLVCWGIPVLIAVVALLKDVLGYDTNLSQASWCWIDPSTDYPLLWMLVTGKAWEVAACVGTVYLYMAVKCMLFRQAKKQKLITNHPNRHIEEANTKLTFVPLVFVAIRIWGTIRFLLGLFAHDYASSSGADWIVIMQGAGDSAQGFANCVIYCFFTSKVRQRLFQRCHCCIFIRVQSSTAGNGSAPQVSDRRAEMSGVRASIKVHANRVVPVLQGTKEHHQQLKESSKLKSFPQVLTNNTQPRTEHFDKCEEHDEHQQSVSSLTWPSSQTTEPSQSNRVDRNTESNKTHFITQSEISKPDSASKWPNKIGHVLDGCSGDAGREVNSLKGKDFSLWATDVPQVRGLWAINHDKETLKGI